MKLLISGGGSGGHLIPGIALYEEFASRGGVELKYVLREQDMKYTVAGRIAERDRFS
jgi:UDP-N-acetylglucosamine:LPS N-acetylglucosamine transferase